MPLRVRLFVYIGAVFLFIMIISFFIEEDLINRSLIKSRNDLKTNIEDLNEEKLEHLEAYVKQCLIDYRTKVNALLTFIRDYPEIKLNFDPTETSNQKKTWLDSATMITNNKWIDTIQNVKNEKIASSILIDDEVMPKIQLYEAAPDLKVTVLLSKNKKPTLVVAVPWVMKDLFSGNGKNKYNKINDNIADFYVLFKPETLLNLDFNQLYLQGLNLSINPLYPFLKWIEVPEAPSFLQEFIEILRKAQIVVRQHAEIFADEYPIAHNFLKKNIELTKEYIEESSLSKLIDRYEQIGLLWGYTTLIASGPFGSSPFDPNAPVGVVRTNKGENIGSLLLRNKVLMKHSSLILQPTFDDVDDVDDIISVILFKNRKDRCCFGNTITFRNEYGVSKLIVGVSGERIFKELALATSRDILFISNNEVVSIFNSSGEREERRDLPQKDVKRLLGNPYGVVPYKGESYFFLHVEPFEDQDFHFFILSPETKEYFLLDQLNKDLKWLVTRIAWQVGGAVLGAFIILLFLLDRVARKITKPIVALAGAAELVKEGHFEDAFNVQQTRKIPHRDEVNMLYEAFYDMVNGLKEKEKVRGILNKVVSTAIANEILKKELYLGGEEKDVTIFFSDIRNFTGITENMKPQDVITVLNSCMTKISKVIDDHDGVIDKYVGDEVMALFGAPIAQPGSTLQAVICGMEVIEVLRDWNKEREAANEKKIEMGIGIHRGRVLIGNMGAQNRLNYTVIGSNVNLSSRLCSHAQPNEILISKEVYEEVSADGIEAELTAPVEFKGFSSKIEVYRVLGYKKKD